MAGYDVAVQDVLPDDPSAAADYAAAFAEVGTTWFIDSRWDRTAATPERLLQIAQQGPPSVS